MANHVSFHLRQSNHLLSPPRVKRRRPSGGCGAVDQSQSPPIVTNAATMGVSGSPDSALGSKYYHSGLSCEIVGENPIAWLCVRLVELLF